jgi:hypothetical protein
MTYVLNEGTLSFYARLCRNSLIFIGTKSASELKLYEVTLFPQILPSMF